MGSFDRMRVPPAVSVLNLNTASYIDSEPEFNNKAIYKRTSLICRYMGYFWSITNSQAPPENVLTEPLTITSDHSKSNLGLNQFTCQFLIEFFLPWLNKENDLNWMSKDTYEGMYSAVKGLVFLYRDLGIEQLVSESMCQDSLEQLSVRGYVLFEGHFLVKLKSF